MPQSTSSAMHRRDFFHFASQGLTGAALATLLGREKLLSAADPEPPRVPHHEPKVKRVIHVCLLGGLSHLDSFDYKPDLIKLHGKPLGGSEKPETFFGQIGLLRGPDFAFQQRGQSGLWISDLFPHLAREADSLTVLRSMAADSANHTPATFQENTGFRLNGFPTLGAWLSYGLGSLSDDLPAYVVLPDPRGLPAGSTINWSSGFLPAQHQGVAFRTKGQPIDDLQPARTLPVGQDQAARDLLATLNRQHADTLPAQDPLEARMRGYELAARMQLAVPQVVDLSQETKTTHTLYGTEQAETRDFGRACLLARRLLEKGVRFVQLFSGGSFGSPRINWDGHENVKENHTQEARRVDQPVAALLKDLRQRGLLKDTLVLFTTEFGRTPFAQSAANQVGTGRDHNMYGFSVWMAGAGLKPGLAHGATDAVGWKAVENVVRWHDFHATVLHLLGIDHERLTYYHNGIQRRLTNVHGEVVESILS